MTDRQIELSSGTIRYRDVGQGQPIVFVHGLLVDGSLWRTVVAPLEGQFRCIAPDWPLGSHTIPMKMTADLTPSGVAALIDEFLEPWPLRARAGWRGPWRHRGQASLGSTLARSRKSTSSATTSCFDRRVPSSAFHSE